MWAIQASMTESLSIPGGPHWKAIHCPSMCVKHRSRRPSLGRRILFIITLKTIVNSVVRLAMTLLSQKQIIQKILRSDFDQEPTQEETAQAITAESKTEHKRSFMSSIFYKTFCLSSRSRSRRRRTLVKVCCTIFSCFVFNKIFFMWIKCFMIRLILKIYKNIFESCSPVHRVEVAQHLEQENIFELINLKTKTLDL